MSVTHPNAEAMNTAVAAFRRGQPILVSDAARPERGAIVVAVADRTSDDLINFMATYARGIIGVAMLPERLEWLGITLQGRFSKSLTSENWCASIEARQGVSTGISAADRAQTIQVAANRMSRLEDLISPGHIFPAMADGAGVMGRQGWAEVGVDLGRIAGTQPVSAFCSVLGEDGELLGGPELDAFAVAHGLPQITIKQIVAHRMATESFVTQRYQTTLPTAHGEFVVRAFENTLDGRQHLAITVGEMRGGAAVLCRVHSECLTGDILHSMRCDCGSQLSIALSRLQKEGRGVVLYLRQEGRGIGLLDKIRAYALQDNGRDTVEANEALGLPVDGRDYGVAAQMLTALGINKVRLLTNNPAKVSSLEEHAIEVVERLPIEVSPNPDNSWYLKTKKERMGHLLELV